jgi:hypothetical protein
LKADDLKAESERIKEEAKALATVVSAASLEEKSGKILKVALRRKLVEEICRITRDLNQKTRRKEREIREFPALNRGKEVSIYFWLAEGGLTGYEATLVKTESRAFIDSRMKKEMDVWYARPGTFQELIENLNQDILDGKYDEKLTANPARLIYDSLKDRVS